MDFSSLTFAWADTIHQPELGAYLTPGHPWLPAAVLEPFGCPGDWGVTKCAPGTPQGPASLREEQGLSQNRQQEQGSRIPTTSPGSSPKPPAPAEQGRA